MPDVSWVSDNLVSFSDTYSCCMQRLLDFLKKYSFWFRFLLLEGLSLLLLFRFNSYQKSVWVTSANAVSGKILEWKSDFSKYISDINSNFGSNPMMGMPFNVSTNIYPEGKAVGFFEATSVITSEVIY